MFYIIFNTFTARNVLKRLECVSSQAGTERSQAYLRSLALQHDVIINKPGLKGVKRAWLVHNGRAAANDYFSSRLVVDYCVD